MAREAAAMWPGNQLMAPPPALKAISLARFPARVRPRILAVAAQPRVGVGVGVGGAAPPRDAVSLAAKSFTSWDCFSRGI